MDGRPVLVCTEYEDATADLVIAELNRRRVPVLRFDPGRDFPASVVLAAHIGADGWDGRLTVGDRTADLSAVRPCTTAGRAPTARVAASRRPASPRRRTGAAWAECWARCRDASV